MSNYIEIADDQGLTQRVPIPAAGSGFSGDDRAQVGQLARSEAGRTAGAVAAGNLMTSFLGDGATSAGTQEKAASVIEELGQNLQSSEYAPAPINPVQTTESGLAVVQAPVPAADYALPDDLAWLNDDEPDEEDELPIAAEADPAADEAEFDEAEIDADPRLAKLLAERKAADKKAAHERGLRLKQARPAWEAEAVRVFRLGDTPLLTEADIKAIKSDSRNDFLRKAKAVADERKQWLEQSGFQPQRAPEIVTREKQEQWGPAPAGAPPADLADNNLEARLARARRSGKLSNSIKEMIRGS